MAIVDAAAGASAHTAMLQTYTGDTMTLDVKDTAFFIAEKASARSLPV